MARQLLKEKNMPIKPTKRRSHQNNRARLTAEERAVRILGHLDSIDESTIPRDLRRVAKLAAITAQLGDHVAAQNARAARRKAK